MGRSPCCEDNGLKKGPWTPEEDQNLVSYIQKHGHGSWRALPKLAGLNRCGKSCRLRWTNYLRPDIKRGKFSQEEEQTILSLHAVMGNKWSAIATHLPGRTDNEIKNFWNTHLKKKLIQMGYDPMTHQPRTDIFSSLPQLTALANLIELLDHRHQPWDQQNAAARLQAEAFQLARLQCLGQLLNPLPAMEASDMDTINLLNSLSLMKNNSIQNNPSLGVEASNAQIANDPLIIPFSHMPELKSPCAYQPLQSNKDTVQAQIESVALISQSESSPNSPWVVTCSSTPSPSPVAPPPVTEGLVTSMIDNCSGSSYGEMGPSIWPSLFLDDALFHEIA
ncbi:hypothetical protein L6164_012389 [Bauhinia variegata]|uniref:Uncharacterized protein n=1 Tax=Bauhinia variegata TaxID=167791 RepID=A0ACB9PBF0_BAUVA|nr:hypothetical protein L6164_012389 [Bauhinia variegata]